MIDLIYNLRATTTCSHGGTNQLFLVHTIPLYIQYPALTGTVALPWRSSLCALVTLRDMPAESMPPAGLTKPDRSKGMGQTKHSPPVQQVRGFVVGPAPLHV